MPPRIAPKCAGSLRSASMRADQTDDVVEGDHLDLRRHLVMQSAARTADQQLDRVAAGGQGAREDERGLLGPAALEMVEIEGQRPLTRHDPRPLIHAHDPGPGTKMAPPRGGAQAQSSRPRQPPAERAQRQPSGDCRVCTANTRIKRREICLGRSSHTLGCGATAARRAGSTSRCCLAELRAAHEQSRSEASRRRWVVASHPQLTARHAVSLAAAVTGPSTFAGPC